jgi:hypothetical protein
LMKYSVNTQSLNGTLLFRVHWLQSKSTYNAGSSFGINDNISVRNGNLKFFKFDLIAYFQSIVAVLVSN